MTQLLRVAGAALLLAVSSFGTLMGQGWIEGERPRDILVPPGGVHKVRSAVHMNVAGRVAHVTVEEWFRNDGPALGEAVYHYPLPGEAVFMRYSLWQDETELTGEMMDARRAREIYESIVRKRKDPALIELAGHGLLRARVFPIAPGQTRKIALRYTQVLDRIGDAVRLRYAGGRDSASRTLTIEADNGAAYGEPYSPTHRVTVRRTGEQIEVRLADPAARGDLEIFFPLTRNLVGLSLLTHRGVGEDGYFMLLLAPGLAARRHAVRRDLVAVLDVSGSMSGEKLRQAQQALGQLVGGLRNGERFRLIAFSSRVRRYAAEWTNASTETRARAQEWIRSLTAEGGTNIAGALTEAFAQPPREVAMGVVVFLTDGRPSVDEQNPERLAERAEQGRGRFRVFAVGIGHDVNTYLLDRLTERARGATNYVAPGGDIEQAVGALAAKLASPVLTDLALRVDGGTELYDLEPRALPDLFAGEELVVMGRYRSGAAGQRALTLTGRRDGREERFTLNATFPHEESENAYVASLWAARHAGSLSREIRLRGPSQEVLDELRQLALRHGILTEYTSYLVQEPDAVARTDAETRMLSLGAPAPSQQAGQAAVERSARERAFSGAVALDEVEAKGLASPIAPTAHGGRAARRVGGRLFLLRDSVWTDAGHETTQRVVSVAPFSDAYFALLQALPEARAAAGLQPAVVVAGRSVSIKIEEGGKATWRAGELATLVRAFRT